MIGQSFRPDGLTPQRTAAEMRHEAPNAAQHRPQQRFCEAAGCRSAYPRHPVGTRASSIGGLTLSAKRSPPYCRGFEQTVLRRRVRCPILVEAGSSTGDFKVSLDGF